MPLNCSIFPGEKQQNSSIVTRGDDRVFQRLEDLRIDADKTQKEIAEVLNCKREVYRRYEKGIHELPVWTLIQLAQYYGVSTDYILGLSDKR